MLSKLKYSKEIVTRTVRLRLLENDTIYYTFLENGVVDEKEHLLNHKALHDIADGKRYPMIIDSYEIASITPEAKKLIRKTEESAPITCRAVVVISVSQRMLANFFIKFHDPFVPTTVFDKYEDAISWASSKKLSNKDLPSSTKKAIVESNLL